MHVNYRLKLLTNLPIVLKVIALFYMFISNT